MRKSAACFLSVCVLCLIPPALAFGQIELANGSLHGIVTDDAGKPIASAKIELKYVISLISYLRKLAEKPDTSPAVTAITDKHGRWTHSRLRPGVWDVYASAQGYFPASRKAAVTHLHGSTFVLLKLERTPEAIKADLGKNARAVSLDDILEPREREILAENGLLEMADSDYLLKKYDEAIALYETYLRAHPDSYLVDLSVAYCHMEKGDLDKAVARFKAVVEASSKDPLDVYFTAEANAGIADCYWKKKDAQNAKLHYKRAAELSNLNELWPFNLAEICFSEGETDEAILFYEKAAQIAPTWSDPEYKMGLACIQKGQWQKAKEHLERFLVLEPYSQNSTVARRMLNELKAKIPLQN